MQKLRQDKVGAKRPSPRRWFRPRSIKKMMVEMEKPFVWPEVPKDLDACVCLFLGLNLMEREWELGMEWSSVEWKYIGFHMVFDIGLG